MRTQKIENYDRYEVSDTGLVISLAQEKPKILKSQKASQSKKGYLQVRLYNDENKRDEKGRKIGKLCYVHRLVWEAFMGEIPQDKEIDHIDGNPHNNNLNNLQLLTRRENTVKYYNGPNIKYLRNHRDEIIKDYVMIGNFEDVASKWDCSPSSIWRIINNKTHKFSGGSWKRAQYDDNNDLFVTTNLRHKEKEDLIRLWEKNYGAKFV